MELVSQNFTGKTNDRLGGRHVECDHRLPLVSQCGLGTFLMCRQENFNPQISQIYTEGFTAVSNHQMSQLLTPLDFGLSRAGPELRPSINGRHVVPGEPIFRNCRWRRIISFKNLCKSVKSVDR
jgi:hypothetical protein